MLIIFLRLVITGAKVQQIPKSSKGLEEKDAIQSQESQGATVCALEGTTLEKAQIYLAFCSLNRTLSFARRYFRSKRQKKIFFLLPFAHLIVPL